MNIIQKAYTTLGAVILPVAALAQTEAIYQDNVRPIGMEVIAPVMQAASDSSSADFQVNELPTLLDFVDQNLNEASAMAGMDALMVDPSKIQLSTDSQVRVYFVHEGAGYRNTLGFSVSDVATGSTIQGSSLIFPDVSSGNHYYSDPQSLESTSGGSDALRNDSVPLVPGDFVDLGVYTGGSQLDFFLIANGANGGGYTYDANVGTNPDSIEHMVAFAVPDSPYLLIGFEDLFNGGDMDFNDAMFVVEVGFANVAQLAPEPGTWMMMAVLGAFGFALYRRGPSAC